MKLILLATGATLLASAVPALAQDAASGPSNAAPAATSTFTGPRAEIFGGWDRVGTRTRFDDGTTRDTSRSHKSGGTAGGLIGYDMPIGDRLVAGVFGSYAISTAKQCFDPAAPGDLGGCLKSGRELEGGARIGAKLLNDKALLYAKGAYVNGQIRAKFGDATDLVSGHANRDGWRAGAGIEYALNQHVYVKTEYDYTRFKSFHADDFGLTDTSLRYDRNQVLGGFGVRF